MDNFEYLQQISKSNRPTRRHFTGPKGASNLKILKVALGGVVVFFLLMGLGSLLGNLGGKQNELTKQLYSRTTNLNGVITSAGRNLKSSRLRAINSSLTSILTHTSNQLSAYLKENGSKNDSDLLPNADTVTAEAELTSQLELTLTNARLNGVLDRVYDNQVGLQVSLLLSMTSNLIARSPKDEQLLAILQPFYTSLYTIHENIESYSETKAN